MPSLEALRDVLLPLTNDVIALGVLLGLLPVLVIATLRAKGRHAYPRRAIAAYETLRRHALHASESGRPLHVALGGGALGSPTTAEALMGLTAFDYAARHAAAADQPVLGTVGDAGLLAGAQGVLQVAREEAGYAECYRGHEVSFSGPAPLAYAAGAHAVADEGPPLAGILLGSLGSEALWLAEAQAARGLPQVGGATDPTTMALLHVALDEAALGEEVFAVGAYLHRPSHGGSLAAQDIARVLCVLAVLAGVVAATLGYWR